MFHALDIFGDGAGNIVIVGHKDAKVEEVLVWYSNTETNEGTRAGRHSLGNNSCQMINDMAEGTEMRRWSEKGSLLVPESRRLVKCWT
jgi:hypothetical protein